MEITGGAKRAVEVIDRIVKNVDVLVGNEEDLQKGLGMPGPEVAAKSKLDPSAFIGMIGQGGEEASEREDRCHHSSRSPFDKPAQLECGGMG